MGVPPAAFNQLAAISNLNVVPNASLSAYTRFQIGGPAALLCDTTHEKAFLEALRIASTLDVPRLVIGGGTNLIVSDAGFDGIVIRYTGSCIKREAAILRVAAGAVLQDVVDASIAHGLAGLQTMTGIPGYVGGAVYGNAGAYGRSMHEIITHVTFFDGKTVRTFMNAECEFRYRESIFKAHKDWIILSTELQMAEGDSAILSQAAHEIRTIRDAKYPPAMRCAGSIFKNVFFADVPAAAQEEIPANLVRDGKVPSAWFLEQTGVKGMRVGDIQVAAYHANLIYNDGVGIASDLLAVIKECKRRVRDRFGFDLEEEVQYVGF